MKKITFAQYGCGEMGKRIAGYAMEKGAVPVAAMVRNPENVGKDLGEFIGKEHQGVKISSTSDAGKVLAETKPDVCIIATKSLMKDIEDILLICAENGINAITTCEEALYPWNSSPAITAHIDEIARKNNCTITGSGANEAQYGGLFALFGGNVQSLHKLSGSAQYNVDDYGDVLALAHGVGLSPEEFDRQIASADRISDEERIKLIDSGDFMPSYVWNANGWICDFLGLEVNSQKQQCVPIFADKDVECKALKKVIPAGRAIGMKSLCSTETAEGITINTECIGFVYNGNEEDTNILETEGEPNSKVIIEKPDTARITCAIIVNRIPDLIKADPGFVPTSRMSVLKIKTKNLESY